MAGREWHAGERAGDGVRADFARSFWRKSGGAKGRMVRGRSICASLWGAAGCSIGIWWRRRWMRASENWWSKYRGPVSVGLDTARTSARAIL